MSRSALLLDPLRIRLSRRASARILLCVHKLRVMLCRSAPKNSAASQSEWPGGSAPSAVVGTCTNPVAPAPVQLQAGCQLARRAIRTSCPRAAAQKVSASRQSDRGRRKGKKRPPALNNKNLRKDRTSPPPLRYTVQCIRKPALEKWQRHHPYLKNHPELTHEWMRKQNELEQEMKDRQKELISRNVQPSSRPRAGPRPRR